MSAIGKHVLVGLTYLDAEGEVEEQEQFHGVIVEGGGPDEGVTLKRADTGEVVTLPPGLEPAEPGEYTLRSSGETVVDPDFVATWTISPPEEGDGDA
jgi:hypothetical protein